MTNIDYEDYLKTLNKISRAITSDLYLEDILKLIVTLTANVMKAKVCNVWLIDEKKQEFNIKATQSMHQEYLKKRTIKLNEGIVGLVAREKKPKIIFDVLKDEQYKEKNLAIKEGLVSMASIPMIVKNEVIGVLNVYTNKYYEFTTSEITLLSTIANQAAVAIEKTELIVKTKIIQEELETRKKVEKAKGILMKEKDISEEEAFSLIRKSSMDKRISMKEIAEAIILSDEIRQIK
ncbi:MAG: histidine kinase [Candidatus Infernicultor aquiphilus]|uniref:Histidine kinase n=1 Tax=Candidatus Infernicultor aquiphilus TaxID=1805029 RepID=A0A1J5GBS2_9BACT|nr:GAF and ANTAR domain-containing protein [bacterium]OIP69699.1 MAG: histidine kinase [Candidatus Atribacteria bacterium CG2_30_33_13]PIU25631.1 MAG: histidine kinase [Candidatus Atribacteria bacterium CG08_land_8_20_14_0_20_33_29]PIW11323.1 MAG: histidine kinase [Candidatus Atribacteria bacterium CG17_big_fil_post_rev_8_21_14_2_50_34_11]PIX34504.1 MAG: histidine kinase [Candidatus Atribacteria bacterium CG_4_8_14_3_um_filter_34_18]PIY32605.1 MAG: histidine kinase [Candidatus Atribacteria bac